MDLKPCPFRRADDEGRILCDQVRSGDPEVSPAVCRACPIAHVDCLHLRATLSHTARPPLTVHYRGGRTEIWEDPAPPLSLERAACGAKVIPILSPHDCAGCALRQALAGPPAAAEAARTNLVAKKVIRLQEWLTRSRKSDPPQAEADPDQALPLAVGHGGAGARPAVSHPRRSPRGEERPVGWTD